MDDLMDQTVSYDDGFFIVRGNASELTTIDPKINIYHDCNDGITVSSLYSHHCYDKQYTMIS